MKGVPHNRMILAMHIKLSFEIAGVTVCCCPIEAHVGNGPGSLSFTYKGSLLPSGFG
jgi:hypothetical protein